MGQVFLKQYYQQVRNPGAIFIRYDDDKKPLDRYIKDGEKGR